MIDPSLSGRTVVLVDGGLASGHTMLAAIKRAKAERARKTAVAVATGSRDTVRMVSAEVDEVFCLNVRFPPFVVADAYRNWYDLTEEETVEVLRTVA